jgi:dienelactone hydrolase
VNRESAIVKKKYFRCKFSFMKLPSFFLALSLAAIACNNNNSEKNSVMDSTTAKNNDSTASVSIREEDVNVSADTATLHNYIAYDQNKTGKRPIVLVIPEWWGLNDYPKSRARQLAGLGFFAVAVDIYGNGRQAADPKEAGAMAETFYANPKLAFARVEAALTKAKSYPEADTSKVAAIGYCFGGSMVLDIARMGMPLDGVVSFHGILSGLAPAKKSMSSKVLVCQGADDKFSPLSAIPNFKNELDAVGASYSVKEYPGATHAFTNPAATEAGKKFNIPIAYNPDADKNSWNDMKDFFAMLWQ